MGAGQVGIEVGRLEEVRQRVKGWRETRPKLEPMPQELWDAAVALACEHGVYRVARALRVDYGKLKQLLELGEAGVARGDAGEGGFAVMTLPVPGVAEPMITGAEVELYDADGSRLSIRLPSHGGLDVVGVVAAFRGHAG